MTTPVLPFLIIVTGRPAAGKTTLARKLAGQIRCPLISRDAIKEGLVNTFQQSEAAPENANKQASEAFFATLDVLLKQQITLVAEAAFQHKVWFPWLEPLQEIAHIRMIHCDIDPALATSRFLERSSADPDRDIFHDGWDAESDAIEKLITAYDPPRLDVPVLTVDTTEGYVPSLDEMVDFVFNSGNG